MVLPSGTEKGYGYDISPEEVQRLRAAESNEEVKKRYEQFLEKKRKERESRSSQDARQVGIEHLPAAAPYALGSRPSDSGTGLHLVRGNASEAVPVTSPQEKYSLRDNLEKLRTVPAIKETTDFIKSIVNLPGMMTSEGRAAFGELRGMKNEYSDKVHVMIKELEKPVAELRG